MISYSYYSIIYERSWFKTTCLQKEHAIQTYLVIPPSNVSICFFGLDRSVIMIDLSIGASNPLQQMNDFPCVADMEM